MGQHVLADHVETGGGEDCGDAWGGGVWVMCRSSERGEGRGEGRGSEIGRGEGREA